MLKQVEIDASKIQRVKTSRNIESKNTESKIIIEKNITKSNEKNVEIKLLRVETTDILNKIEYESE